MRAAAVLLLALPAVLWVTARLMWGALVASEAERAYLDGEDEDGGSWPEFGGGIAPGEENNEKGGRKA